MKILNSRTLIRTVLIALSVMLLFSACASLSRAAEDDALEVIYLINEGKVEQLTSMTAETFLLDAEILQGAGTAKLFWSGLAEAGFKLNNPVIIDKNQPSAAEKAVLGNSIEVDTFFTKYVTTDSMYFRIASDSGEIALIIGPDDTGELKITAFGGPF
ncbi:MAG: hypothetical protein PQJ61_07795 [Spirochaetales bacterium]|uniref:Uncharacterized protein n=1 Tax=Candidatus Thalassospirochaeta sargassi TaxID=3119039 RepID=A0AAJ1MJL7_9SPIO|nr:hypothetical protein [Spirochaetales bacterium]